MPEYTPHSVRKTLFLFGSQVCESLEELKAWSLNLGHENLATSYNFYLPMSRERQCEILKKFQG